MKKPVVGVLLLAAACAHGPSGPTRAHAPIYLASVEGMSDEQNRLLAYREAPELSQERIVNLTATDGRSKRK